MRTFRLRASESIAALVAVTSVAAVALGLSAVGLSACATATTSGGGSADASTGDDAGGTSGGDAGDAGGGGVDAQVPGVGCTDTPCDKGQTCCATNGTGFDISCAPACDPDGGSSPVECDGPEDCDSLNPLCCAHVTGGPVEAAGCPWTHGTIVCSGRCETSIGTTCGVDETTARVCHTSADCAGNDPNTNCCEFRASALPIWMCVDDAHKTNAAKCL